MADQKEQVIGIDKFFQTMAEGMNPAGMFCPVWTTQDIKRVAEATGLGEIVPEHAYLEILSIVRRNFTKQVGISDHTIWVAIDTWVQLHIF